MYLALDKTQMIMQEMPLQSSQSNNPQFNPKPGYISFDGGKKTEKP